MQQEMEYIYRVYQEKSFSKAAESLYMTQPALSTAIRKVEQAVGMPIFDRSKRPLSLTSAGEAYIKYIEESMHLEQDMYKQIQDIRELNTGSIRIGGSHYINAYILPNLLKAFSAAYPGICIDLIEDSSASLSEKLNRKEVDVTFNCNPRFFQDYERYPAFHDHVLLAVPGTYAVNLQNRDARLTASDITQCQHLAPDCPVVSLKAFEHTDFILLKHGNNLRDRAEELFQNADIHPPCRQSLSQLVTAYHLCQAGIGATFVSDKLVSGQEESLFFYKLPESVSMRNFFMLLPRRSYKSQVVTAFISFAENYFSNEFENTLSVNSKTIIPLQ